MPKNDAKKLTNYVSDLLDARLPLVPDKADELRHEAEVMSDFGVNSEEDHKIFWYIFLHVRKVAEDIIGKKLGINILNEIFNIVFKNREYYPIDTILNFYRAVGNALKLMQINISKRAYPLGQSFISAKKPYNIQKWIQVMREIYLMVHKGQNFNKAFDSITAKWDEMEKNDFRNWMKFYQENSHMKYKTADYLQDDEHGPLWVPPEYLQKGKAPSMPNMEDFSRKEQEDREEAERTEARNKKINALSGRFRAVLKLISDPDVQKFLKDSIDIGVPDFVRQIQELQRHLMLVPLRNKRSSIFEDLIIQHGNRLASLGFPKAGALICKIAQGQAPPVETLKQKTKQPKTPRAEKTKEMPDEVESKLKAPETEKSDEMSDELGSGNLKMPSGFGGDLDNTFEDEWVDEFIGRLNGSNDSKDKHKCNDVVEAHDELSDIVVEAQELSPLEKLPLKNLPLRESPAKESKPIIEVEEEPELPNVEENAFSSLEGVTIKDIVERLERVANILKNREIPRELAWIDFMLDRVGLASYFPTLAEATKSALESNQYMSTRIDDILSKLRGSIEPKEPIELAVTNEEEKQTNDTLKQVRQNLQEAEQKEKTRKEQRKNEELEPNVPAEELTRPVNVETAPPAPVR